jgi:alanine-synthesizing transaminase
MNHRLTIRRDLTVKMLNAIEGISCVPPKGAFYAFPRLHISEDDDTFVKKIIEETGVVVVPGSGFGQVPGTRHFRLVFLPPEQQLEQAYDLLKDFMKRHSASIIRK